MVWMLLAVALWTGVMALMEFGALALRISRYRIGHVVKGAVNAACALICIAVAVGLG